MKKLMTSILIGVVLMTTGCTSHQSKRDETPEDRILAAKHVTQRDERSAVALADTEDVKSYDQMATGSLVACSGGQQWAGHTSINLANGVEASRVIDSIRRAASSDGWKTERDENAVGGPRLTLTTDGGVSLLISPRDEGATLQINSFSKCIPLPDDFVPEYSY